MRFADEGTYRPLSMEDILAETRRTMVDRLSISTRRLTTAFAFGYNDLIAAMNNHYKIDMC
ncbi:hypothetical protein ABLN97_05685 [Mycobacterium tuberculosis]